jgi:hypothetical protein
MRASLRALTIATAVAYVIGLPVVWWIYRPATWPLDVFNHAIGRDFVNVWAAGRLLLEGNLAALFDTSTYNAALHRLLHPALDVHYWSYPPTSLLLAAPFGLFPYGWALLIWTVAGLAAFLAAGRIGLEGQAARMATVLLLIAPATTNNIICGQNGFISAALLAAGFLHLQSKPVFAGVMLGLLTYKPHLGIVVAPALVVLGAWRTIAVAILTACTLVAASLVAFGLEPYHLFLTATLKNQAALLEAFYGFFIRMMVSPYSALRILGWSHDWAMSLQVVLLVATVAAVVVAMRQTKCKELRLAVVASAAFVASPYSLTYDLPILALIIARLAVRNGNWTLAESIILGSVWAIPLLTIPLLLLEVPVPAVVVGLAFALFCMQVGPRLAPVGVAGRDRASPSAIF